MGYGLFQGKINNALMPFTLEYFDYTIVDTNSHALAFWGIKAIVSAMFVDGDQYWIPTMTDGNENILIYIHNDQLHFMARTSSIVGHTIRIWVVKTLGQLT